MHTPREVIFFTKGDSADISTWSNVPYFFTRTLEEKGVTVHRVNIDDHRRLRKYYNRYIKKIYGAIYPQNDYDYQRSKISKFFIDRKIKRAVAAHPNADLCIFIGFDFWNAFSAIPTLLFCDWTYKIYLEDHLKKPVNPLEQDFMRRQREAIGNARLTVSLFEECAVKISADNPAARVSWIDSNVVNSIIPYDQVEAMQQEIIGKKQASDKILFIGKAKYKEGAQQLIDSFMRLVKDHPALELDIIGMHARELRGADHPAIRCHGYLRKDVPAERQQYYDLLIGARVVVNPSDVWAGYSSIIESMYFYTPVITSRYQEFTSQFGEQIAFGHYVTRDVADITARIAEVFAAENYSQLCEAAHAAVKDYRWDVYVDKLLAKV